MSENNTVPGSGPNDQDALKQLAEDAAQAAKDFAAIKAAHDAGGTAAVAALVPGLIADVKKDIADVTADLPLIKAGWRTSEFWLMVGVLVFQYVLYPIATKNSLPWYDHVAMDTLASIYAGSRHIQKNAVLQSPHQS